MAEEQQGVVPPEYFPNQPVEIEVPEGILQGVYNTRIANLNEQALLLGVPQVGNLYLPLKIGQPFKLRYVVESWAYETDVTISARRDNSETPLMLVARPKQVSRRLMRKFFRVGTIIDVNIHLISDLSEYGREKFADSELTGGVILDISGGGGRIRTTSQLQTDGKRYAILWFTLPLIHKSFYNMLTRIKTVTADGQDKYVLIEFTGLSEDERDDIVQYCLRQKTAALKAEAEIKNGKA